MRILVGVKRVIDYAVKVRVLGDKSAVDVNNVKMALNPFCEIALEEAVRLKEKKIASEIIAVSIGPKASQETLRTALAIGADKGIHINTDARTDQEIQPLAIAKVLKAIAEREKANLVIVGKQSIDGDNCQTGQMLAGLLGWSQCTFASKLAISDDKTAKKKPLELLVAADLGLDLSPQNIVLKVEEPAARKAGIFVESVDALLDKLRNEAAVVK
eukprot:gene24812-32310_t